MSADPNKQLPFWKNALTLSPRKASNDAAKKKKLGQILSHKNIEQYRPEHIFEDRDGRQLAAAKNRTCRPTQKPPKIGHPSCQINEGNQ